MKKVLIIALINIFMMGIFTSCQGKREDLLPAQGIQGSRNAVVFLGDSITEGYGLSTDEAYPSLIQSYWDNNNIAFRSVNEGISGNTTTDIINRLDDVLTEDTCFVFLEIGANDAFKLYKTDDIKMRIIQIIKKIQERNIKVALMAMEIPEGLPGISSNYMKKFAGMYDDIGKELDIPVMPSLLKESSRSSGLFQNDGVHPTSVGQRVLAKNVLKFLNGGWILE